jgi:hypothetical protein
VPQAGTFPETLGRYVEDRIVGIEVQDQQFLMVQALESGSGAFEAQHFIPEGRHGLCGREALGTIRFMATTDDAP